MSLVLISDAVNTETAFGQIAIFFFGLHYVPIRLKILAGGCYVPVRWPEKNNKETHFLHITTKQNLKEILYRPIQPSEFMRNKNSTQ